MSRVGKKATSCGEKVENWRKNKMHDGQAVCSCMLASDDSDAPPRPGRPSPTSSSQGMSCYWKTCHFGLGLLQGLMASWIRVAALKCRCLGPARGSARDSCGLMDAHAVILRRERPLQALRLPAFTSGWRPSPAAIATLLCSRWANHSTPHPNAARKNPEKP